MTQIEEIRKNKGKINEAIRTVYTNKPDALNEYWWTLNLDDNMHIGYNSYVQGMLYDYQ